jgi:hypothetical protein
LPLSGLGSREGDRRDHARRPRNRHRPVREGARSARLLAPGVTASRAPGAATAPEGRSHGACAQPWDHAPRVDVSWCPKVTRSTLADRSPGARPCWAPDRASEVRCKPRRVRHRSSSRQFGCGAPGRTRTADAHLRTVPLYPLSYGGAPQSYPQPAPRSDPITRADVATDGGGSGQPRPSDAVGEGLRAGEALA